jgi:WD40 repeat protein
MSSIRLVNFAEFNDKDNQLIVGGINGVFVYDFNYKSKYSPQLAATIDQEGKHITIALDNQQPLDKNYSLCRWVKGLKIDHKNEFIVTWNKS